MKQFGGLVYKDVDLEETVRWAYFEGKQVENSLIQKREAFMTLMAVCKFLFYLY